MLERNKEAEKKVGGYLVASESDSADEDDVRDRRKHRTATRGSRVRTLAEGLLWEYNPV